MGGTRTAIIVTATVAAALFKPVPTFAYKENIVSTNVVSGSGLGTSDGKIAWLDARINAQGSMSVLDLRTGDEIIIANHPHPKQFPAIHGNVVAWKDSRPTVFGTYVYDLAVGVQRRLPWGNGDQWAPQVYEDIVVWMDIRNLHWDIYGHDLTEDFSFRITSNGQQQEVPDIHGDVVVWRDTRNGNQDVYGYRFSDTTEFPIETSPIDQSPGRVHGDVVIYQDSRSGFPGVYAYRISDQSTFTVTEELADVRGFEISGDLIVWSDNRDGDYDVYAYDLTTGDELQVTNHPDNQEAPSTDGEIIAWYDNRGSPQTSLYWAASPFLCGNGVLDLGEECDDGGTADGDCCSATCDYETDNATCYVAMTVYNVNALVNGDPVWGHPTIDVPLNAGIYRLVPTNPSIDPAATFTAWKHNVALPWHHGYGYDSTTLGRVTVAGIDDAATALEAFEHADNVPEILRLSEPDTVMLFVLDGSQIGDNEGGLSLRLERFPICGDSVIDAGESCDPPTAGICSTTCQTTASCVGGGGGPDDDGDGYPDACDNCVAAYNPDQENSDCLDPTFLVSGSCADPENVPHRHRGCCLGDLCDPCPAQRDDDRCDAETTTSEVIGADGGSLGTSDAMVSVVIPEGVLDEDRTLSLTQNGPASRFILDQIRLLSVSARPEGIDFREPVTMTMRWHDRDGDGTVDLGVCIGGDHDGLPCDEDFAAQHQRGKCYKLELSFITNAGELGICAN